MDLDVLADFFLSQPRGWHLPHFLEGNWVDKAVYLSCLFDEYTRYRDPDDYTLFEDAMHRFTGPQSIGGPVTGVQDSTSMEWPDRFSSLPTELRLAVLCFLPSLSVEAVKDASQSMAAVPLKVTYWLSRLSEPKFCHLPASYLKKYGHLLGQQWARILLDEQLGKTNRYRVIRYNESLVSKMLQRKAYLASLPTEIPKNTYYKLVASPDEPHTVYQKSEKTVTWQSTIAFEPDIRINAVIASYVHSWSGQSLSGLTFLAESRTLKLGYTDTFNKQTFNFEPESRSPRRIDLQTDSRGIFSVVQFEKIPFAKSPYTLDRATLNIDTVTKSTGESTPFNLFDPIHATQPAHAIFGKLLHPGSQLGLVEMEIIHGANAQDALPRKGRADAIHERAARGTEIIGHGVARGDRARLAEGLQIVTATQVLQVRVGHGEIGCEHGRRDFVAV
ncbi:MAG: hypothetical protein Q9214_006499 [Letrouitia sp. 1 TL-2023]